jgi:hypothetical protein
MNENLRRRVMKFVSHQAGVDLAELSLDTLVGDLVLEGGLGLEFMMEFAEAFKVDLSQFDPDQHIGPETGFPILDGCSGCFAGIGSHRN